MTRVSRCTLGRRLPARSRAAGVALMFAMASTALIACSDRAAAATYAARIDAPRAFGHTIGDVMSERVLLVAAGRDVGNVEPPASGRIDLWLERRPARVEADRSGRRWLVLDYQITNAPRSLTQIALPALSLRIGGGDVLQADAWPISVGPIIADTGIAPTGIAAAGSGAVGIDVSEQANEPLAVSGATLAMQQDRGVAPLPLAPIKQRIGYALAGLVSTLAGWLAWWLWRNHRDAAQLPFARGWRQMRARCASGAPIPADAAWRIVHRALNETAGQVIHRHSLSRLFARAPWLAPMQPQLEQFYERSQAQFFVVATEADDRASAAPPARPGSDAALAALLLTLSRAERRRHR